MSYNILKQGRVTTAEALVARTWLVAIASGSADWDADPAYPVSTDLAGPTALLGYARLKILGYAKEDAAGSFSNGNKTFKHFNDPQENLLMQVHIQPGDLPVGTTIRELVFYTAPTIADDVNPGNLFIPSDKVTNAGSLYAAAHFAPEVMTAGKHLKKTFISRP